MKLVRYNFIKKSEVKKTEMGFQFWNRKFRQDAGTIFEFSEDQNAYVFFCKVNNRGARRAIAETIEDEYFTERGHEIRLRNLILR
jgi:hypothetical protein